jgi:RimJ/RimL family protein N-acetyltransferase
MQLKSGNVSLRPLRESDAKRMAELLNNVKIGRNLRDGLPYPYTVNDALEFIEKFGNHPSFFAVEYNGEYAGNISLSPHENVYRKTAEIGYLLGEPYWGKGIMTTAVELITEYGFKVLGFARIHTGVYEFNPASQKVLEKCGYQKEGIMVKNVFKNGELHDEIRFAIINPAVYDGTWISGE